MLRNDTSSAPRAPRATRWARLGAAALVGAMTTIAMGGVAHADRSRTPVGVSTHGGMPIYMAGEKPVTASKIQIQAPGAAKPEFAYCVDYRTPLGQHGYVGADWRSSGVKNLPKVKWILTHSFPTVTVDSMISTVGGQTGAGEPEMLVYAGTQAAIWHFSDGVNLDTARYPEQDLVRRIYQHLVTNAKSEAERIGMRVLPASATATVNEKAGPFTISGNTSTEVTVSTSHGKVVDSSGKEISTVKAGDKFYVTSNNVTTATVKAEGKVTVEAGRVFVYGAGPGNQQKIILAGKTTEDLTAESRANFGSAGSSLPVTGTNAVAIAVVGCVLLGGGGAVLFTIRRRKVTFAA